jgi:anthranilate phosphoribosyltransferase
VSIAGGISGLLDKVMRRENLTMDESAEAMAVIMDGDATPAQISALLVGLTMKGERPAEIAGLAYTMRRNGVALSKRYADVFDTCGTGGDRAGTFNISSAAALVVAAAGVRVAKHGNRSVSSRCGSADVYEQLGVDLAAPPAVVERSLDTVGIAFFFAPTFHPSMRQAAPVRRELGVRTAFNLLGPLTNPAGAARQLVGVPQPELTELMARALLLLGGDRAWVVHGCRRRGIRRSRSAGTAPCRLSTCIRPILACGRRTRRTSRARTRPPTRRSFAACSAVGGAHAVTSCC